MQAKQSRIEDVACVIVSFNSEAVLGACIDSLKENGVDNIVVVDNASTDRSRDIAHDKGAHLIVNAKNEGFGRAATTGVEATKSDFVLLINPDAKAAPGCIETLRAAADFYPTAGLLAPRLTEKSGRLYFPYKSLVSTYLKNPKAIKRPPEGDCCVPFVSGAAIFIRRAAWEQSGGFDREIFLFYEDDDLCCKLIDAGWSIVHIDKAHAYHIRGNSNPPSPEDIFRRRWHLAWSRGYVSNKYGVSSGFLPAITKNIFKWALARLTGNAERQPRYAGSVAGALAWRRNRRALSRENLE